MEKLKLLAVIFALLAPAAPVLAQQGQWQNMLEITYGDGSTQVVPLDQPSPNISRMEFRGGARETSGQASLTRGWDLYNEPLTSGQILWRTFARQGAPNMEVSVQLTGAKPNHEFTVGVHLFNRMNLTARFDVAGFGGWEVGGAGVITREGQTAYVIAYDFGGVRTDARGDGAARFNVLVPPGNYALQFTLRIGAVGTCRAGGPTHGCAASYRSGNRFAERLETVVIP